MSDEVRVTPWREFDGHIHDRVRIWERSTPFGMFQAHEWRNRETGEVRRDPWIPAAGRRWAVGAQPAADPDPDPLRAALEAIRDGHNDPRALAQQVLGATA